MEVTPDVAGAGNDFTWVHYLKTGYSVLVHWEDTTQVYNCGVTDGGAKAPPSHSAKLNVKSFKSRTGNFFDPTFATP